VRFVSSHVSALTMLSRRAVVLGGLLTVVYRPSSCYGSVAGGCTLLAAEAPNYFGKAGYANAYSNGEEQIEQRSGNPQLDRALAHSLAMIARTFDVLPAFAYYDDGGSPNAHATPAVLLERTDGTVLFGLQLLQMVLAQQGRPDASIVTICAHEFGHIVSYKNHQIDRLAPDPGQPFRAEQYADYMAGFFAGVRKLNEPDFPAVVFATTVRSFGGGDHGTPVQRGEAAQQGFLAAYSRKMKPAEGIQAAFEYAMSQTQE
jgi:hypothetical protein